MITSDYVFRDLPLFRRFPFCCPICGAEITAHVEAWVEDENGQWMADDAQLDCVTEPDIDDPEWEGWFNWHYSMPYVDWLPLSIKVKDWINERFRFKID